MEEHADGISSDRRLRLHIERTPLAVIEWSPQFRVVAWNPAAERIFGYPAAEALGRHPADLIVPASARAHVERVWQALIERRGGETSTNENRTRDGRRIICEWHNTPLVTDDGRVAGVASFARDITEQSQLAEALRQSEERYRVLVDSTPDFIYSLDRQGRHTAVNLSVCAALGKDAHEIIGKDHRDLGFPPAIVEEWRALHRRVFDSGAPVSVETRTPMPDGTEHIYEVVLRPLRDGERDIVGIRGVSRDVSERKRLEAERERLAAEVLERGALLQTVIDSAPVGIALLSGPDYTCELANEAFRRLLPDTALFGARYLDLWRDLSHESPPDLAAIMDDLQPLTCVDVPVALVRSPAAPERAHFTFSYVPVRRPGRDRPDLLVLASETTERVQLEQQFRQAQKMEAVGRLAGGIAHDFNNLLTAILGYCEMTLEALGPDHPSFADVEQIRNAGTSAARLTRQLLAFSRKQILQPAVHDLNAIVAENQQMFQRVLGEDIDIVVRLGANAPGVKVDRGQVEQVLMNLIVNSRDAMPDGGRLTIETANVSLDESYARMHVAVVPGSYVMLAVSDTGCGMSPEVQARLFEPFFTTKAKGQGTGLGLATVYGIVKQSGGNIWAYSEPGHGTTFKVYLPLSEEDVQLAPSQAPANLHSAGGTILLVEDDEPLRRLAATALARSGYEVLPAGRPDEAIRIAAAHQGPIVLLVTDVVLPGTSGRVLADTLLGLRPDMRVLYMSGYTDNAIVHHGVLEPDTPFLQKPFTPTLLVQKVREVLGAGGHTGAASA